MPRKHFPIPLGNICIPNLSITLQALTLNCWEGVYELKELLLGWIVEIHMQNIPQATLKLYNAV